MTRRPVLIAWYEATRPGFCCECGAIFEPGDEVRPDGFGGVLCGICGDPGPGTEDVAVSEVYL